MCSVQLLTSWATHSAAGMGSGALLEDAELDDKDAELDDKDAELDDEDAELDDEDAELDDEDAELDDCKVVF